MFIFKCLIKTYCLVGNDNDINVTILFYINLIFIYFVRRQMDTI